MTAAGTPAAAGGPLVLLYRRRLVFAAVATTLSCLLVLISAGFLAGWGGGRHVVAGVVCVVAVVATALTALQSVVQYRSGRVVVADGVVTQTRWREQPRSVRTDDVQAIVRSIGVSQYGTRVVARTDLVTRDGELALTVRGDYLSTTQLDRLQKAVGAPVRERRQTSPLAVGLRRITGRSRT